VSIINFRPEVWSARLLIALRKELVYGGPMVVNRDYEGDIQKAGDTVRITSISRPAIQDYVPNVTKITFPELTDAQRTLVVDQSKFWSFSVDDVDAAQAAGDVMPQATDEAGYALSDTVDQFIAGLWTGVAAANDLGSIVIDATTKPTDFYDKVLVPLRTRLKKSNVPTQGRYVTVTPEGYACLLLDSRFVKVNESGTTDGLRNGIVGTAAGFTIMETNNAPNTAGEEFVIQAGTKAAISFADKIRKTEALRPQDSFSDGVKGLALYGAKLLRPTGIAVARVTVNGVTN
jgi:hypothetical protein